MKTYDNDPIVVSTNATNITDLLVDRVRETPKPSNKATVAGKTFPEKTSSVRFAQWPRGLLPRESSLVKPWQS